MVQPELSYLSEALLVSHGFSTAQELGSVLSGFVQQLKYQVGMFLMGQILKPMFFTIWWTHAKSVFSSLGFLLKTFPGFFIDLHTFHTFFNF